MNTGPWTVNVDQVKVKRIGFPHRCPGFQCAVCRWAVETNKPRARQEILDREAKAYYENGGEGGKVSGTDGADNADGP